MCNFIDFSHVAIESKISNGDYRTYMILCALALENQAETGEVAIELSYAEIGERHPKPLTTSGVRSRINRLMKAGLVERERLDSKRWRTILTLSNSVDNAGESAVGTLLEATTQETHHVVSQHTQPATPLPETTASMESVTVHHTQGERPISTETPSPARKRDMVTEAVATDNTQPKSPLSPAPPSELAVATNNTQPNSACSTAAPITPTVAADNTPNERPLYTTTPNPDRKCDMVTETVATGSTQPDSPLSSATPSELTVASDNTQTSKSGRLYDYIHPDGSTVQGDYIELSHGGYEDDETLSVLEKMRLDCQRKGEIRAAMAALQHPDQKGQNQESTDDVGAAAQNAPSLIIDHDHDLYHKQSIHDHDQINSSQTTLSSSTQLGSTQPQANLGNMDQEKHLTTILANLPKPMNPDGIVECLQQPDLCAAWLAYATNPAHGVRNPAAYVRKGVRSGHYPPNATKAYVSPNSPYYTGKEKLNHESTDDGNYSGTAQGGVAR
ncbi:MAG: hypothetical protein AAF702_28935 [Chloroflexota bacterium]